LDDPINYLALGDSITVSADVPPGQGYVDIVGRWLKQANPQNRTQKICKKGIKTKELFLVLHSYPPFRQMIRQAHLISLWIGGNDIYTAYAIYLLSKDEKIFTQTIEKYFDSLNIFLDWLHHDSSANLYLFTLYNPFPHDHLGNQYIPKMNDMIAKAARKHKVQIVDIYSDFKGKEAQLIKGYRSGNTQDVIPFLLKNPVHPNEVGQHVIANCFCEKMDRRNGK
jgi:lysophospholipase L1-like esterase